MSTEDLSWELLIARVVEHESHLGRIFDAIGLDELIKFANFRAIDSLVTSEMDYDDSVNASLVQLLIGDKIGKSESAQSLNFAFQALWMVHGYRRWVNALNALGDLHAHSFVQRFIQSVTYRFLGCLQAFPDRENRRETENYKSR